MKTRPNPTLHNRVVWQSAALLLAYPDEGHLDRLDTVDRLLTHITGRAADLLRGTVATLQATDALTAAREYVETFDMQRTSTLYLTYWTAGDTRNRGSQMLSFSGTYRDACVAPPAAEAPDFLPVVLEFAATVDPEAGRRLLVEHRVTIDILLEALTTGGSPYANVICAVCETLPPATDHEVLRAQHLMNTGAPAEAVGLQPFTLTVPPRRGGGD